MITTFYPPYSFGGDAVFVQSLARALARRGHEVDGFIAATATLSKIQPHDAAHWGLGRAGRTPIAGGNRPAGAGVGRSKVRQREG